MVQTTGTADGGRGEKTKDDTRRGGKTCRAEEEVK